MFIFLLTLLMGHFAWAQIVTASFQASSFGENPAAAATREFGVISPSFANTNITQDIAETPESNYFNPGWDRELQVQKGEIFFSGRKYKLVPEVYLAYNKATIQSTAKNDVTQSQDEMSLINNQLNLAYRASSALSLGFIVLNPRLNYFSKTNYQVNGAPYSYQSENELKVLGLGGGLTLMFAKYFAIGGFYHKISENREFSFEDSNPVNSNLSRSGIEDSNHEKYGYGISFQHGKTKTGGYRLEISRSKMNFGSGQIYNYFEEGKSIVPHLQDRVTFEATLFHFVFGITYTQIQGRYINYRYLAETVISEFPYYEKPVVINSGFIGFKTKNGSSVGGTVSYFNGNSEVNYQGQKLNAKINELSLSLNYAYIF